MTGNGLVKGFARGESAEVERLSPSVLVQIRGQVVVALKVVSFLIFEKYSFRRADCFVRVAYSAVRACVSLVLCSGMVLLLNPQCDPLQTRPLLPCCPNA